MSGHHEEGRMRADDGKETFAMDENACGADMALGEVELVFRA